MEDQLIEDYRILCFTFLEDRYLKIDKMTKID